MRRKLTIAFIIMVMALAVMPEALRQVQNLNCMAHKWTRSGLWNGFLPVVYAGEKESMSLRQAAEQARTSKDDFHWQGRIEQGRAIEIKGVLGEVRAEASSGNEVEVFATKRGRRSDPAEVRIQVVEHPNGVTICAVYPNAERPNTCEPGSGGHSSVHNNDVNVDFTVRVPSGVRFIGRTVNGRVEADSIGSDVEAYTVNGGINVKAIGLVQAKTVNGSINASMGRADWTRPLEFSTVNGSITLDMPADVNTEFEAETVNGDISTDYPLTVQGSFSRRHVQGTIGNGGRKLTAQTVNGSIKLRRTQ